jgi:hypothetical protein
MFVRSCRPTGGVPDACGDRKSSFCCPKPVTRDRAGFCSIFDRVRCHKLWIRRSRRRRNRAWPELLSARLREATANLQAESSHSDAHYVSRFSGVGIFQSALSAIFADLPDLQGYGDKNPIWVTTGIEEITHKVKVFFVRPLLGQYFETAVQPSDGLRAHGPRGPWGLTLTPVAKNDRIRERRS